MPSYLFVGGNGPDADYDLSNFIKGRTIMFSRTGPATVQWNMDGRSSKASDVVEMEHDLKIYRDKVLFYRGKIQPATDDISGENHQVTMGSFDYRGKLEHRLVHDGWATSYFDTEQGTIAWNLISAAQALTNGNEGITQGSTATGILKDHGFDVGQPIAEVIEAIAETNNGFDWEITPALVLNCYYPKRGTVKAEPLDYGGAVFSASRRLKRGDFANAVIGMGQGFLIPEELETAGIATDPRGRWEKTVSWPDVEIQEANDGRTQYLLDQVSSHEYTYTLKLRTGWWQGPSQLWLGDEFNLRLTSGRMNIDQTVIIESIKITLDDSGIETVEVEAG